MPDPYGIMPLSLSVESDTRTVYNSSSVVFGAYTSSKRGTYSSQSQVFISFPTSNSLSYRTGVTSFYGNYLYVPAGCYFDITANVSYTPEEYSSLVFSGGYSFSLGSLSGSTKSTIKAYPDTCQILVNGSPVGDVVSCSSSGQATFNDTEVVLTDDVTAVGVRFTWTSADTASDTSGSTVTSAYQRLYCYPVDSFNITPVIDDSLDYEPFFNRVIAWEQSIFSAINALGDSLSTSLGGVGESASKIASVFARDDDIQLRDDVDDTLKEVTTQFYDQTSTSSSSMTVEAVQNVKGISDGMDAMFSSGYSVSAAFTEIAENDDFMSWFTAETAQALDSTGNVATVDDEDKYNMHFYYDQVNAIAERRGD